MHYEDQITPNATAVLSHSSLTGSPASHLPLSELILIHVIQSAPLGLKKGLQTLHPMTQRHPQHSYESVTKTEALLLYRFLAEV